jgi:acetyl esterase/lipase
VIPGAGPHDLRDTEHDVLTDFLGGSPEEEPERYALASPIVHVGPDEPPFLLINGGADWLVDVDQSRAMRARLRAAGNQAELLSVAGGGHLVSHGSDPGEVQFAVSLDTPEAWLAVADFLDRTVGAP